jgi:hypothetical protein
VTGLPPVAPAPPQRFGLYLETWETVVWFRRLQTQWRYGPNGPVGLDYGITLNLFTLFQVEEPCKLLDDLRIMEDEWLACVYEEVD